MTQPAREPELWTLWQVACKADWEGGLRELWEFKGDGFTTNNTEFNMWWTVYCKMMEVQAIVEDKINEMLPDREEDP